MLDEKREKVLIGLCRDFVRRPSLSGSEGDLAHRVAEEMRALGYDQVHSDEYGSVVGCLDFSRPGRTLLFDAQMDHVGTGDFADWSFYPYGAVLEGDRLCGRGASDQKGALAAMILAGAWLKADRGRELSGTLMVAGTVHQEEFEGVASRAIALRRVPDLVVIGEASGLKLVRGQRGRAEILLETFGRMAHSSTPERGVNAADRMVRILSEIRERFEPPEDSFLGRGILVLVSLSSLPAGAVGAIPDRCRATFDRRLLTGETREGVLEGMKALLPDPMGEGGPDVRVSVARSEERCYTGAPIRGEHFAPAWALEEGHPFLRTALEGLASEGLPAEVSPEPGFGTNGCGTAGRMGIPTLVFGPSREELVHVLDEYVELDQLTRACRGYYGIAAAVLGGA